MSAGTEVVQRALKHLGVHSPLKPAAPETLEEGKNTLNGMLAMWRDRFSINMGTVPLNAIGDELSEPLGAKNEIEYCLAISMAPMFPGSKIVNNPIAWQLLQGQANKGFQSILSTWGTVTIPRIKPRRTLPKGQGNKRGGNWIYDYTFYPAGSELG